MYKITYTILLFLFCSKLYAESINPGNETEKNRNLQAIGITLTKKLKLIEGISSFDESKDSIFVEPNIFYDKFKSNDAQNYNYGLSLNLGYNYNKTDILAGIGYLRSTFDYVLDDQISEPVKSSHERNAFFYSITTRYQLNKYASYYLQSKFYKIEFKDDLDNDFKSDNISFTLGVSLNL